MLFLVFSTYLSHGNTRLFLGFRHHVLVPPSPISTCGKSQLLKVILSITKKATSSGLASFTSKMFFPLCVGRENTNKTSHGIYLPTLKLPFLQLKIGQNHQNGNETRIPSIHGNGVRTRTVSFREGSPMESWNGENMMMFRVSV